ncbi:uncharacterized protein [Ptychodera flava]|uniref:uncharacterized protein n=1 Tax=Ptychodera flava TaxID=63121 RepID=UPI00396A3C2E
MANYKNVIGAMVLLVVLREMPMVNTLCDITNCAVGQFCDQIAGWCHDCALCKEVADGNCEIFCPKFTKETTLLISSEPRFAKITTDLDDGPTGTSRLLLAILVVITAATSMLVIIICLKKSKIRARSFKFLVACVERRKLDTANGYNNEGSDTEAQLAFQDTAGLEINFFPW